MLQKYQYFQSLPASLFPHNSVLACRADPTQAVDDKTRLQLRFMLIALMQTCMVLHVSHNRAALAIEEAAAAIAVDSSWVKGYYFKALALEQLPNYARALKACEEGLRVHRCARLYSCSHGNAVQPARKPEAHGGLGQNHHSPKTITKTKNITVHPLPMDQCSKVVLKDYCYCYY